jgi:hypothetical protein
MAGQGLTVTDSQGLLQSALRMSASIPERQRQLTCTLPERSENNRHYSEVLTGTIPERSENNRHYSEVLTGTKTINAVVPQRCENNRPKRRQQIFPTGRSYIATYHCTTTSTRNHSSVIDTRTHKSCKHGLLVQYVSHIKKRQPMTKTKSRIRKRTVSAHAIPNNRKNDQTCDE